MARTQLEDNDLHYPLPIQGKGHRKQLCGISVILTSHVEVISQSSPSGENGGVGVLRQLI